MFQYWNTLSQITTSWILHVFDIDQSYLFIFVNYLLDDTITTPLWFLQLLTLSFFIFYLLIFTLCLLYFLFFTLILLGFALLFLLAFFLLYFFFSILYYTFLVYSSWINNIVYMSSSDSELASLELLEDLILCWNILINFCGNFSILSICKIIID